MLQNQRIEGSPWHSTSIKKLKSHSVPSVRGITELVNFKVKKFYKVYVSLEAGLISRSPTMSTGSKMLQSTNISHGVNEGTMKACFPLMFFFLDFCPLSFLDTHDKFFPACEAMRTRAIFLLIWLIVLILYSIRAYFFCVSKSTFL